MSGYTTGAAVHVFTSQLRHIFGLELRNPTGLFRVPRVREGRGGEGRGGEGKGGVLYVSVAHCETENTYM